MAMSETPSGGPALHELRVALIGFGEVGGILGRALRSQGLQSLRTYDRLFDDSARRDKIRQRCVDDGVEPVPTSIDATADADLVLCAVTADQTSVAAAAAAKALRPGAFY